MKRLLIDLLTMFDTKWSDRRLSFDCKDCFMSAYGDWSILQIIFKCFDDDRKGEIKGNTLNLSNLDNQQP